MPLQVNLFTKCTTFNYKIKKRWNSRQTTGWKCCLCNCPLPYSQVDWLRKALISLAGPNSDHHLISSNNNTAWSNIQVMRMNELITKDDWMSWHLKKSWKILSRSTWGTVWTLCREKVCWSIGALIVRDYSNNNKRILFKLNC